ncbi:unnamed protein product [Prorocentrum cordatum]|uniref:Uncharacterized protein n=1 Tax=Prorocentrum cordatum TaxID=2364126 RepID=A0ABN9UFG7_9DINO|nr:unnamed protein product [Polarella glacialis]
MALGPRGGPRGSHFRRSACIDPDHWIVGHLRERLREPDWDALLRAPSLTLKLPVFEVGATSDVWPEGQKVPPTPASDLRRPERRHPALGCFSMAWASRFTILTTASLPWRTGTAVNPTLRAAYLARSGREVTLVLPWLPDRAQQAMLYPEGLLFDAPHDQVRAAAGRLFEVPLPQALRELLAVKCLQMSLAAQLRVSSLDLHLLTSSRVEVSEKGAKRGQQEVVHPAREVPEGSRGAQAVFEEAWEKEPEYFQTKVRALFCRFLGVVHPIAGPPAFAFLGREGFLPR